MPSPVRPILLLLFCAGLSLRPILAGYAEEREAQHARQFAADGRPELVVAQCRQFRERFPASAAEDAILELEGQAWQRLGRHAEALSAYQNLLQRHSTSPLAPAAQLAVGDCLEDLGRTAEAVKAWRRTAQLAPASPLAAKALLKAEAAIAPSESATREELLRLAAETDSQSELGLEARRRWASLLAASGRTGDALNMLERVLRESAPGSGQLRVLLELDQLLAGEQRGEEAAELLARHVDEYEIDAVRGRLWLALARRRLALGRRLDAERGLRGAIELEDPQLDPPAVRDSLRLLLGDALAGQGLDREALQAWSAMAGAGADARLRRARAQERLGERTAAAGEYVQALELLAHDPQRRSADRLLGAAMAGVARLRGDGVPPASLDRLAMLAGQVDPADPSATELAEALIDMGRIAEADRLLEARSDALPDADRRALLRLRSAVAARRWSAAVELGRIFHERWSLSPRLAEADSLAGEIAAPRAGAAEHDRLAAELVRGRDADGRGRVQLGWLELRDRRRPREALAAFDQVPPEAPSEVLAEAGFGRLCALVELGRAEDAWSEWEAGDKRLARSPWSLRALQQLWRLETSPSAERRRERIAQLEALRRAGRVEDQALAAELLAQWDGLRAAVAEAGGSAQARTECARKALQWADSLREPGPAQLLARSLCRETAGNPSGARLDWRRLMEEHGEDPASLVAMRALALDAAADSALRAEVVGRAREEWPWHPLSAPLRLQVAALERSAGRPAVSLAICRGLLEEGRLRMAGIPPEDDDPALLDELARSLEESGARAEARRVWFAALGGPVLADTVAASRMLLAVARSFQADERIEDARRAARTLTSAFSGTPAAKAATRLLAVQESAAGRHAEALELLESLKPASGSDIGLRAQWLKALARSGRADRVKGELARLLKESGSRLDGDTLRAAVALERGLGLLERGDAAEAEKAFGQVGGKAPQAAQASLGMAECQWRLGKGKAALKTLEAFDKRWTRGVAAARAAQLRASMAEAQGDVDGALAQLERSAQLCAGQARRESLARWCEGAARMGRPEARRRALEACLAQDPPPEDETGRKLELALVLASLGEQVPARASLRALLASADGARAAEIQFQLGAIAEQEGDLATAVLEYQKVAHLPSTAELDWDASAGFAAAACWERLERREEAVRTLEEIIRRHGTDSGHGMRARAEMERLGAADARGE